LKLTTDGHEASRGVYNSRATCIDYEKAFDAVNWRKLMTAMVMLDVEIQTTDIQVVTVTG